MFTLETIETPEYTVTYKRFTSQNLIPNGTGDDTYIVDTPNEVLADSVEDFSNEQGDEPGEWQYGYYTNPYTSDTFTLMPKWDEYFEFWYQPGSPALRLNSIGGHPYPNKWAVRRWVSDYQGEVQVNGIISDLDTNGGNGFNALVLFNGVEVFNKYITSSTEQNYQISVNVNVGDVIDLVIDPKDFDYYYDTTQFTGIIAKPVGDNPVENPNEGNDKVQAYIDEVLPENIENLELLDPAIIGRGNNLPNLITGNSKNNFLVGSFGQDTLNGGAGNDILVGDGEDILNGGSGSDTVSYVSSGVAVTVNLGNNTAPDTLNSIENIIGTWFSDNITGNAGDNILNPGDGEYPHNNFIDGGTGGNDVLQFVGYFQDVNNGNFGGNYDNQGILMTVTFPNPNNNASGKIYSLLNSNIVTFQNIDRFEITGTKVADNIIGGKLEDTLKGGKGDDSIDGAGGNDILDGGEGKDVLSGGTGNDIYVEPETNDQIIEESNGGTDLVQSSKNYILEAANVENITLIGNGNTLAVGNNQNNNLTGNSGKNTLIGNEGNDSLNGGTGVDTLMGGAGNDQYTIENAKDFIAEAADEGTDNLNASINATLPENVENLNLTGTTHLNGTGNKLNNTITGNSGNNILKGNEGNDSLKGNEGNDSLDGVTGQDSMQGGAGNDQYTVDNTKDQVKELLNEGTDLVKSTITHTVAANVENLLLLGTGNINGTGNILNNSITGNIGNNKLTGKIGNDILNGQGGDDLLVGELGQDILTGGLGSDRFGFNAPGEGIDTIKDFISGIDKIQIMATGFGGRLIPGALNEGQFVIGTGAIDGDDRFIYNGESLFYDVDGLGGATQIKIATLTGFPVIVASDIVIV